MQIRALGFLLLAAAAAACGGSERAAQKPAQARPNYLAGVPRFAGARVTETTGTPEVDHEVSFAAAPLDSVAAFFRRELPARGWKIQADVGDTANVSIFAQRGDLPLWIQIHRAGSASQIVLTAAGPGG